MASLDRFQQYMEATGLDKEEESRKVSTLLYCLGVKGDNILTLTGARADERKEYTTIIAKLDEYYKARRNIIYEQARFNKRDQTRDKTAEQYISALYMLAETCQYGTLQNEMIRDQLVIGIRDTALSDKQQMGCNSDARESQGSCEAEGNMERKQTATKRHRQQGRPPSR